MSRIHELLDEFIGQKLIDVSHHDADDKEPFCYLMFETGGIKITLADGYIDEMEYGEESD
jgi:hypothetical protein